MTPGSRERTVTLTPNWPNTTRWFARVLAEHGFDDRAYAPVASFIEQVRYMQETDPKDLQRIIDELHALDDRS